MYLSLGISNDPIFLYLYGFVAFIKSSLPPKDSVRFHVAGGWDDRSLSLGHFLLVQRTPRALGFHLTSLVASLSLLCYFLTFL